jgi:ribosomal protein L32
MATQVQCPNCGGYKVSSTSTYVDPKTRKKVGSSAPGCIFSILTGVATFFAVPFIVLIIAHAAIPNPPTVTAEGQPSYPQLNSTIAILELIFPFLVGFIVYRIFYAKRRQVIAKAITVYHSVCSLCGYSWQWDEGHPRPVSQVRPDLIAKGEKKLQEEAQGSWWQYNQVYYKNKK